MEEPSRGDRARMFLSTFPPMETPHDHNPSPRKKLKIEEEEVVGGGKDNVEDAGEDENERNHGEVDEDDRDDDDDGDDDDGEEEATMDRLSSLPCHILELILSYMPTKSVVTTALLSRRWRYVWASSLHLDFDDFDVPRSSVIDFIRFVGSAITSRRYPSALLSFRLALRHGFSHLTVSRWLRDADVFNLASLRILRLATSSYALPVDWPSSARLPSLDTLVLVGLQFYPSDVAADFISSACPRLRSCSLKRCKPLPRLDVDCPLLEQLFLANLRRAKLQDLRITAGRLKRLSVTDASAVNARMTLAISAPSIESFGWCSVAPREYRVASPTSPLRSQVAPLPRMFRKFHRVGRPVNLLRAFSD